MNYKYHPRYQEEKELYSREVVARLYPEIKLEPIGSANDKKGIDGWYQGESVQIKYDKVIPYSGNIYHEYREKFRGRPQEMWRNNEFHADWWIFVSQTKFGSLTFLVALSEMRLWEKGKKLVAIPYKAPTSMGYTIPVRDLVHKVRKEISGSVRGVYSYVFTTELREFFHRFLTETMCYIAPVARRLITEANEDLEIFGADYTLDKWAKFVEVPKEGTCPVCGSSEWWYRPASELGGPSARLCGRCHPNPNKET